MTNRQASNMFYLLDKLVRGKQLQLCKRCGLKYEATVSKCPHCSHISEHELSRLLSHRAGVRLGLGKMMWMAAVLLIVIMIFFNLS